MAMFKKGDKVEIISTHIRKFLGTWNLPVTGKVTGGYGKIVTVKLDGETLYSIDVHEVSLVVLPVKGQSDTTFNSQAEVWQYLLTGGNVQSTITRAVLSLKDGRVYCAGTTNINVKDITFSNFADYAKYIEPAKWYENIPATGILCWCWGDFSEEHGQLEIITEYCEKAKYKVSPRKLLRGNWSNARPATPEEVATFIYNPNK